MKVELVNQTDYANIYVIYEKSGKPIGEVEVVLAGRYVGTYCYSLGNKYNRRDIRRFYNTYKQ